MTVPSLSLYAPPMVTGMIGEISRIVKLGFVAEILAKYFPPQIKSRLSFVGEMVAVLFAL